MLYYKSVSVTRANQVETMTNVVGSGGSMGVRASGLGSVAWKDGDLRHLAEEGKCQEAVACIVALEQGNSQR